jgi:hypothetical protein
LCDEHHIDSEILKNNPTYNANDFKKLEIEIDKMMDAEKIVPTPPLPLLI